MTNSRVNTIKLIFEIIKKKSKSSINMDAISWEDGDYTFKIKYTRKSKTTLYIKSLLENNDITYFSPTYKNIIEIPVSIHLREYFLSFLDDTQRS